MGKIVKKIILGAAGIALGIFLLLLVLVLIDEGKGEGEVVSPSYADHHGELDVSRAESATVMLYLTGYDNETSHGSHSAVIDRLLRADLGDKVQVVIETGRAKQWHKEEISDGHVQRWLVKDGALTLLEDRGTEVSTMDTQELSSFLQFADQNYPADRKFLIFSGHGGGLLGGFGGEEMAEGNSFSLPRLRQALGDADVHFEMIGFSSCLMGSLETAWAVEPFAEYLVASPEISSSQSWSFEEFLDALGMDITISSDSLLRTLLDYQYEVYSDAWNNYSGTYTLSVLDLSKIPALEESLNDFFSREQERLSRNSDAFSQISRYRNAARAYGGEEYDSIDLIGFLENFDTPESEAVIHHVEEAVIDMVGGKKGGYHGLAMYFPYYNMDPYNACSNGLRRLGLTAEADFYQAFVEILESRNDKEAFEDKYQLADKLTLGERSILELTEEDWQDITDIMLEIRVQREDGSYYQLGQDDRYRIDENGNVPLRYDYQWIYVDDTLVSFFADPIYYDGDTDRYYKTGSCPAMLNGEDIVDVVIAWDPMIRQNDIQTEAHIQGYRKEDEDNDGLLEEDSSLLPLQEGDSLTFLHREYDENRVSQGWIPEDAVLIGSEEPKVSYQTIPKGTVYASFHVEDVYQNERSTGWYVFQGNN